MRIIEVMVILLICLMVVLDSDDLFTRTFEFYLRLGCSDSQAEDYATNDLEHWFGKKDSFSYNLIRF